MVVFIKFYFFDITIACLGKVAFALAQVFDDMFDHLLFANLSISWYYRA
jgi:hypothetical protein